MAPDDALASSIKNKWTGGLRLTLNQESTCCLSMKAGAWSVEPTLKKPGIKATISNLRAGKTETIRALNLLDNLTNITRDFWENKTLCLKTQGRQVKKWPWVWLLTWYHHALMQYIYKNMYLHPYEHTDIHIAHTLTHTYTLQSHNQWN